MGDFTDVVYGRKLTTSLALREEMENASPAISMTKVTQIAVCHTNKNLEAFEHLL